MTEGDTKLSVVQDEIRVADVTGGLDGFFDGSGFDDKEIIVGKAVLAKKAYNGIVHRLANKVYRLEGGQDVSMASKNLADVGDARLSVSRCTADNIRECAGALGISMDRCLEIEDYVYANEGQM